MEREQMPHFSLFGKEIQGTDEGDPGREEMGQIAYAFLEGGFKTGFRWVSGKNTRCLLL